MQAISTCGNGGANGNPGGRGEGLERLRAMVEKRVRRFGFTDAEADQVVDDILDAWNHFAFDPAKANGAKPETVLIGLVNNRCRTIMRSLARNRTRDTRYGETRADEQAEQPMRRDLPLQLDVREALSQLSPLERDVCEAIANDVPREAIYDRLGISRYRLDELIDGIRSRFTALGLHEWLVE